MADVSRVSGTGASKPETGQITPRSLISTTNRSFVDSAPLKVKICIRGVENLPLITSPSNNRKEPCDACARLIFGNQVIKTAVINGALSARWEHDCELNIGSEDSEELEVELLHCDRIAADQHLGSAIMRINDIIKQNHGKGSSVNKAIEKTYPLITRDGNALSGQDAKRTTITLSFTLLEGVPPVQSDSDDDTSLPKSHTKSAQFKILAESREASFRSLTASESNGTPETKSLSSQPRGGVGLKFKVSLSLAARTAVVLGQSYAAVSFRPCTASRVTE